MRSNRGQWKRRTDENYVGGAARLLSVALRWRCSWYTAAVDAVDVVDASSIATACSAVRPLLNVGGMFFPPRNASVGTDVGVL